MIIKLPLASEIHWIVLSFLWKGKQGCIEYKLDSFFYIRSFNGTMLDDQTSFLQYYNNEFNCSNIKWVDNKMKSTTMERYNCHAF